MKVLNHGLKMFLDQKMDLSEYRDGRDQNNHYPDQSPRHRLHG